MTEIAARFAVVAAGFTRAATAVPDDAWSNPAPCEGWTARDVVRHLVEWVPSFFKANANLEVPTGQSVDTDPVGAWTTLRDALSAMLADPAVCARGFTSRAGTMNVEQAIDMIVTGDVLIHTWDLARAAGLDETLDETQVHRMYETSLPFDEMLRTSGHFGPRVDVPDTADEQTKLLAFMGRRP